MGKRKLTKLASDSDYAPETSRHPNKAVRVSTKNSRKKNKNKHSSTEAEEPDVANDGLEFLPPHVVSTHKVCTSSEMRAALLEWFEGVHDNRGMPWRKRYDPTLGAQEKSQRAYEVWVSEIMLQQTQVATVVPYYNRWMERFPTIRELAAASVDEVNALWKGLGYYSRASRLLSGAQKVVKEYGGRLPDNAKDLEANIPGIGRYSAGAIASIAYGERAPVLDGNVNRLLSRVLALHASPKSKATLDILWSAAADIVGTKGIKEAPINVDGDGTMVQNQYAGDINQALIELGSTVCKVRDPNCTACPLQPWCRGYALTSGSSSQNDIPDIEELCSLCEPLQIGSDVTSYPMKVEKKKQREELDIVNVVEWSPIDSPDDRFFLMTRRPEGGLLAGLYEFPTASNVSKSLTAAAQTKLPGTVLSNLLKSKVAPLSDKAAKGGPVGDTLIIDSVKPAKDVLHIFSHIKKTYRPQWVVLQGGASPPTVVPGEAVPRWVSLDDVPNTNIGTGTMKVWQSVSRLWS